MSGRETAADRSDIAGRLAFVVGALNRRLRPAFGTDDLTHIELSVLATVARAGSIRPGDVARLEGIAAPGATRILTELEHRGLVRREPDPADGRSTLIGTTTSGGTAILEARRSRAEAVERLLVEVDGQDLAAVGQAVRALETALQVAGVRTRELAAH